LSKKTEAHLLLGDRQVVRVREIQERQSEEFLCLVAEQAARGRIDAQEAAIQPGHGHGGGRVLEGAPEALLALAHHLFGLAAHRQLTQRHFGSPALLAERGEEQRRRGQHDQEDLQGEHPGRRRARGEDRGVGLRHRREQRQAQQGGAAAPHPEAQGRPQQDRHRRIQ
jgi:hypothetical protein